MKKTEHTPNTQVFYELQTLRQNEQEVSSVFAPPKESVIDIEEPPTPKIRNSLPSTLPRSFGKNISTSRISQQESYTRFVRSILFEENEANVPLCEKETFPEMSAQDFSTNPDPLLSKIPGTPNGENFLPDSTPSIGWIENELNNSDFAPPIPPRIERVPGLSFNKGFTPPAIYHNEPAQQSLFNGNSLPTSNQGSFSSDENFQTCVPQNQRIMGLTNGKKHSPTPASQFRSIPIPSSDSNFAPISNSNTNTDVREASSEESVQSSNFQSQTVDSLPPKQNYSPSSGYKSTTESMNSREFLPNSVVQIEPDTEPSSNAPFSLIPTSQANSGVEPTSSEESLRNFVSQSQKVIRPVVPQRYSPITTVQYRELSPHSGSQSSSIREFSINAQVSPLCNQINTIRPGSSEESVQSSQSQEVVRLPNSEMYLLDPALHYRSMPRSHKNQFLPNTIPQVESISRLPNNANYSPKIVSQTNGVGRSSSSEESFRSSISQSQRSMGTLYNEKPAVHSSSPFRPIPGGLPVENFVPSPYYNKGAIPRRLSKMNRIPGSSSSEESSRYSIPQNQMISEPPYTEQYLPNSVAHVNRIGKSSDSEESFRSSVSRTQRVSGLLYNDRLSENSGSPFRSHSRRSFVENFAPSPQSQTGAIPKRLSSEKFSTISPSQMNRIAGSPSDEDSLRCSIPPYHRFTEGSPYTERFSPNFPPQCRPVPIDGRESLSSHAPQNKKIFRASSSEDSLRSSVALNKTTLESPIDNCNRSIPSSTELYTRPSSNEKLSLTPQLRPTEKPPFVSELAASSDSPIQLISEPPTEKNSVANHDTRIQRVSSNESFRSSVSQTQRNANASDQEQFLPESEFRSIPGPLSNKKFSPDYLTQIRRGSGNEFFRYSASRSQKNLGSSNKVKFSDKPEFITIPGPSKEFIPPRSSRTRRYSSSSSSSSSSSGEESWNNFAAQIKQFSKLSINQKNSLGWPKEFISPNSSRTGKSSESSSSSYESLKDAVSDNERLVESINTKKFSPPVEAPKIKSILRKSSRRYSPIVFVQPEEVTFTRGTRIRTISTSSSSSETSSSDHEIKRVEGRRSARSFQTIPAQRRPADQASNSDRSLRASSSKPKKPKTEGPSCFVSDFAFKLKWFARMLDREDSSQGARKGPTVKSPSRTGIL